MSGCTGVGSYLSTCGPFERVPGNADFLEGSSSMQRWCLAAACAVAFSCLAVPAAVAKQRPQDRLDAYTVRTTADKLAAFEAKGLDVADSEVTATASARR